MHYEFRLVSAARGRHCRSGAHGQFPGDRSQSFTQTRRWNSSLGRVGWGRIAHVARWALPGYDHTEEEPMPGIGWAILGIIYFVLLVVFAIQSFRKGHWVLGLIGFIFPILWIIGAILPSRYATR